MSSATIFLPTTVIHGSSTVRSACRLSASGVLHQRPAAVVCVSTAAAKRVQDRAHLAWNSGCPTETFCDRQLARGGVDNHLAVQCCLKSWGVLFDSELAFKQHVSKIVSSCFYQLRRLGQLKRHVDVNTMKLLISVFILSRLDYSNVLLSRLPMSTIRLL